MFKDAVRNVEGLGLYPTISFTIFFIFFISLLLYVYGYTKKHTDEMSHLPFDNKDALNKTKKENKNEKDI